MGYLEDYRTRTKWKYDPVQGWFHTHPDLDHKVNEAGKYLRFPGTTVIFRAGKQCTRIVSLMQELLHAHLGDMLAEPLPKSTAHMTLHDLVNPENTPYDLKAVMDDSLDQAVAITEEIRQKYAGRQIVLRADRIVNMMSKSLVLLLEPNSEEDYALLMELYRRYDAILSLPYTLTPHITLAYYRSGMLDGDRLGEVLGRMQPEDEQLIFAFPIENLTVMRFEDMQVYHDVPERYCFICDGGLHRSQMAAALLNQRAREHGLRIQAEARAAFGNTEGQSVPNNVYETLTRHGIDLPDRQLTARYLSEDAYGAYTRYVAISPGAVSRVSVLGIPRDRSEVTELFLGVLDPAYETSFEEACQTLEKRVDLLLKEMYGI